MAISRSWRPHPVDGPFRAQVGDIGELNQVFSDAFTERYRRDGMVGVRVPFLNSIIWRYAIEDAANGAMLWRDERGRLVAFNIAHRSGTEGWMGPLAVRTEFQGNGTGKEIVTRGIDWLKAEGATTIGLETMPRTMDNIGFYSRLGFVPGRLTVTTTLEAPQGDSVVQVLGRLSPQARDDAIAECQALVHELIPGYDYSREIRLTHELSLARRSCCPMAVASPGTRSRILLRWWKAARARNCEFSSWCSTTRRGFPRCSRRSATSPGATAPAESPFVCKASSTRYISDSSPSVAMCAGRICACRSRSSPRRDHAGARVVQLGDLSGRATGVPVLSAWRARCRRGRRSPITPAPRAVW